MTSGPKGTWADTGWLMAATLALWVVCVGPAGFQGGTAGIIELSLAAALCFVPGALVFWMCSRYGEARQQSLAILAAMVVRIVLVSAGLIVVLVLRPFPPQRFLLWVAGFYFGTLGIETLLLLRSLKRLSA